MSQHPLPLIGVSACLHKGDTPKPYHAVDDKYLRAVAVCGGTMPVVIPALGDLLDLPGLVAGLDGVMLTGSTSNVHPSRYRQEPSTEAEPYDRHRDETTLALIHEVVRQGVPLLAICRGFQELNVAYGGSLHPQVHKVEGRMKHSSPDTGDMEVDYGPNHPVALETGGKLAAIVGKETITVNSLHYQAIDQLGTGLAVEGRAEDGTIEAISIPDAAGFALGVQWHPEFKAWENPVSVKIFEAFGTAARHRAQSRR